MQVDGDNEFRAEFECQALSVFPFEESLKLPECNCKVEHIELSTNTEVVKAKRLFAHIGEKAIPAFLAPNLTVLVTQQQNTHRLVYNARDGYLRFKCSKLVHDLHHFVSIIHL